MTAAPATGTELDPDTAATLAKLVATLEQIRQLTADAEHFKTQLRDRLGPGAYTIDTRPALTITPTRRFDPDRAATMLPPTQLAAITRPVVDPTLAKQILAPALYDLCRVEAGRPAVKPA